MQPNSYEETFSRFITRSIDGSVVVDSTFGRWYPSFPNNRSESGVFEEKIDYYLHRVSPYETERLPLDGLS